MAEHIFPTVAAALTALADYTVAQAKQAIAARGRFSLVLSGGSSPKKLYEMLASDAYRAQVSWAQVYFFFGDERYVPHDDVQSNFRMANEALLTPLGIAPEHVFAVETALPPAEAAAAYTEVIQEFFGDAAPQFDLVLLGLGDNSHTASLFPHTPVLHASSVGAEAVYVPELQAQRITLTAPLLNQAHALAFLVFGADKAAAVQRVLTGPRNVEEFPAQLIAATAGGEVRWFLDEAAAAELPK